MNWRQIVECPRGPLTSFRAPKHRQPLSALHIEIRSSLRSPQRSEGRVNHGTFAGVVTETKRAPNGAEGGVSGVH